MKMPRALALLLLLYSAACSSPPQPAELLEQQVRAWNAGDLEGFATSGYWQSPELPFYSGGEIRRGFDAMLERYRESYQAEGKEMGQLSFSETEVLVLDPLNVLARGRWRLVFSDGSSSGGLFTLLLHRMPEGWRIVHDHTSTEEQP